MGQSGADGSFHSRPSFRRQVLQSLQRSTRWRGTIDINFAFCGIDLAACVKSGSRIMCSYFIAPTRRSGRLEDGDDQSKSSTQSAIRAVPLKAPNQLWLTDLTYLKITEWGWYHLSTAPDDFSRFVVTWKLCATMKAQRHGHTRSGAGGVRPRSNDRRSPTAASVG